MKTRNIYMDYITGVWHIIKRKRLSMAIVSAGPDGKVYTNRSRKSKIYFRDDEISSNPEKYYYRPISKPAVEKQTILKEVKKQKKHT